MVARGSKLESKPELSYTEGLPCQAEGLGFIVPVAGSHSGCPGRGRSRARAEPDRGGRSPGTDGLRTACVPGAWTESRAGLSDSTVRKSLPWERGPR